MRTYDIMELDEKKGLNPKKLYRLGTEEVKLREIIFPLWLAGSNYREMAETAAKILDKPVSSKRVQRCLRRIEQEQMEETEDISKNKLKAVSKTRSEFAQLAVEGWGLYERAKKVDKIDPVESVRLQGMAMDKIRQANEAETRLYKMAGIYEEVMVHKVEDTAQWQQIKQAILIYLNHVHKCTHCDEKGGQNVQQFMEFLAAVSEDPSIIDQYLSNAVKRKAKEKDFEEGKYSDYTDV